MLAWAIGGALGINALTFALFGWDKRAARRDARRVPERRLLLAAGLGGLLGAWTGMSVFRHKTRKRSFQLKLAAISAAWLGAAAWVLVAQLSG